MTPFFAMAFAAALQAASPGSAGPVHTIDGDHRPAAPAAAPAPEDDKVVCRHFTQTGSRLGGTTECATKAQWRERERDNADQLRQRQAKAYQFSQH